MLPRSRRLDTRETKVTRTRGNIMHTPHFLFRLTPALSPKATVIVSKKIAARAVGRNKLRRQIYAVLAGLPALPPGHAAIVAKRGAEQLPYAAIQGEIAAAVKHLQ